MFFWKKKEKIQPTEEASEYKRGYNDGYMHGFSKTESNITNFNNNINYIRGYEYGYRVGTQEAKINNMKINRQNNLNDPLTSLSNNDHINNVNAKKEVSNSVNPNSFNNFSKNKF